MIHFKHIIPDEMLEEDMRNLVKIAAVDYDARSAAQFTKQALAGYVTFWRVLSDEENIGMLITRLLQTPKGKILHVEGQNAKGMTKREVYAEGFAGIEKLARGAGCQMISAFTERKGLLKVFAEIGLPVLGYVVGKKLDETAGA